MKCIQVKMGFTCIGLLTLRRIGSESIQYRGGSIDRRIYIIYTKDRQICIHNLILDVTKNLCVILVYVTLNVMKFSPSLGSCLTISTDSTN